MTSLWQYTDVRMTLDHPYPLHRCVCTKWMVPDYNGDQAKLMHNTTSANWSDRVSCGATMTLHQRRVCSKPHFYTIQNKPRCLVCMQTGKYKIDNDMFCIACVRILHNDAAWRGREDTRTCTAGVNRQTIACQNDLWRGNSSFLPRRTAIAGAVVALETRRHIVTEWAPAAFLWMPSKRGTL